MRPGEVSRGSIFAALAFAFSCFCLILFFWVQFGGSVPLKAQGYRFQVSFVEAPNMTRGADVRISGVSVGKVVAVGRFGQRTDATIELESKHAPIPSDTRAIVRSKTLLGEAFVELSPGDRTAPKLADGGRLPARQVAPTQALDQVLSGFDERTRAALRRFVSELAVAVDDRGQDLNSALGHAEPTAAEPRPPGPGARPAARPRARARARQRHRARGRRPARGRPPEPGDRRQRRVLRHRRAQPRAHRDRARALPGFLVDLRGSLRKLDRAGAEVAPDVRTLRTLAPRLRDSLVALDGLTPEFGAFFEELRPVMRAAKRGLPAATAIFKETAPLFGVVYPSSRELGPIFSYFNSYATDTVATFAKAGAATAGTSEGHHYLRTLLPITSENLVGADHRAPTNRYNPYLRPGGLGDLQGGGLRAFGCANTSNPMTLPAIGSAPACREAGPWTFRGNSRSVPARRARRAVDLSCYGDVALSLIPPNPAGLMKRVDGVLEDVDGTLGRVDGTLGEVSGTLGTVDGTLSETTGLLKDATAVLKDATAVLKDVKGLLTELEEELQMLHRLPEIEAQIKEIHAAVAAGLSDRLEPYRGWDPAQAPTRCRQVRGPSWSRPICT